MKDLGMFLLIPAMFVGIGIFLIVLGIWIQRRPYGRHSVEVEAECIDLNVQDRVDTMGTAQHKVMKNTITPVYRYWYRGQYYTSSPMLKSNRPGYHPELGKCRIRINPDHPERVYSTERKFAAIILIGIGAMYLVVTGITVFVIWKTGIS